MRRAYATLLVLCLALIGAFATAGPAQAMPMTITNGTQFTDTSGSPVHAHGGGVIKVGSYYYWFGENRNADNTFRYVDAYRSTDLKNWEFRNHVLTPVQRLRAGHRLHRATEGHLQRRHRQVRDVDAQGERRRLQRGPGRRRRLRTPSTGTTPSRAASVRWTSTCPGTSRSSWTPTAPGTWSRPPRELRPAHLPTHGRLHRHRRSWSPTPGTDGHREAPALFKRNGVYFMLTSAATGWNPNQQQYATATTSPARGRP